MAAKKSYMYSVHILHNNDSGCCWQKLTFDQSKMWTGQSVRDIYIVVDMPSSTV